MGYTFTIGNATPAFNKDDFPYLSAKWAVEPVRHDTAPDLPNDVAGNGNSRSPAYGVWKEFCQRAGIYDLFFDYRGRLLAGHPGCVGITQEDADKVTAALEKYRAQATLPAGFEPDMFYDGPPRYDHCLARLIWLEYWMQWAVKNCETPAIQNI